MTSLSDAHTAHQVVDISIFTLQQESNMAPLDDTTPATRLDSFHVHRTSYKKIGDHEIEVAILVPKELKSGKHPVMVKFHGGGLVKLPSKCNPTEMKLTT